MLVVAIPRVARLYITVEQKQLEYETAVKKLEEMEPSYFEQKVLFQINTICCGVGIAGMIILSLSNQTMSFEISEQFGDGYCPFIMPSFSQDVL